MCRQETHMKCRLKPQGNSSMRKPKCWWQDIKNILPRSGVDYLVQDSDIWETFCEQVQWTLRVYWPAEQLWTAQETSASWLATQKWLYANHKGLLLNMDRSISQTVLQNVRAEQHAELACHVTGNLTSWLDRSTLTSSTTAAQVVYCHFPLLRLERSRTKWLPYLEPPIRISHRTLTRKGVSITVNQLRSAKHTFNYFTQLVIRVAQAV
jgi:hypothetical protein